jgi:hypothetical protein
MRRRGFYTEAMDLALAAMTGLAVLWVPGAIATGILRTGSRDGVTRFAQELALGLAFWPIVFLATSIAGMSWSALGARLFFGALVTHRMDGRRADGDRSVHAHSSHRRRRAAALGRLRASHDDRAAARRSRKVAGELRAVHFRKRVLLPLGLSCGRCVRGVDQRTHRARRDPAHAAGLRPVAQCAHLHRRVLRRRRAVAQSTRGAAGRDAGHAGLALSRVLRLVGALHAARGLAPPAAARGEFLDARSTSESAPRHRSRATRRRPRARSCARDGGLRDPRDYSRGDAGHTAQVARAGVVRLASWHCSSLRRGSCI